MSTIVADISAAKKHKKKSKSVHSAKSDIVQDENISSSGDKSVEKKKRKLDEDERAGMQALNVTICVTKYYPQTNGSAKRTRQKRRPM